jgi:1-aminocyclopropane-1-carboxylate deaminase/D-cysteine desulfhydrase-like pyridoxal-dependent ACC family enzyme
MFDLDIDSNKKWDDNPLTPIEYIAARGLYVKREDTFEIAGVRGGKVRTCWALSQRAVGLCTAGSRSSPQVNIVAHIAKHLNIPCRVHTPQGELSPELISARDAGATIVQHKAGYNNVIIARAREDAKRLNWTNIPFGMECWEAVYQTRTQVKDIPKEVKRIVIPVGSGMSLAGLLNGLRIDLGSRIPVLGIKVGADPTERLRKYGPVGVDWLVTLANSGLDYHAPAVTAQLDSIRLDSHYEAKCLPFLQPGDLFWIVGIRETEYVSSQKNNC